MTSAEEQDVGRKRRRDFEHNRDVILSAADEAFSELGMGASIDTIAKRAGVAPATVYRHFPNRQVLVDAVFDLRIVTYAEAIEAAQTLDDPREAFRETIHTMVALQARDRSFREIVASRDPDPFGHPGFDRFVKAMFGALESAHAAGVFREDVTDSDILLFLLATEGIARPAGRHDQSALRRLVDIALDGFCSTRTALRGEPLEPEQLLDVSRS